MSFETDVWAFRARLYAYALKLTKNHADADDLVGNTLLRALTYKDKFTAGTNLSAWLFTLCRNDFLTGMRKSWRSVEDPAEMMATRLPYKANQMDAIQLHELQVEITKLPKLQQEALILVAIQGFSYEEVAQMLGTAEGTVKSRVSRARSALAEAVGFDNTSDPITQSVLTNDNFSDDPS